MNLTRDLKTVGMACFVKYFEAFQSTMSHNELAEHIAAVEGYAPTSTVSRVRSARRIFREKMVDSALSSIISSKLTDQWVRVAAEELRA